MSKWFNNEYRINFPTDVYDNTEWINNAENQEFIQEVLDMKFKNRKDAIKKAIELSIRTEFDMEVLLIQSYARIEKKVKKPIVEKFKRDKNTSGIDRIETLETNVTLSLNEDLSKKELKQFVLKSSIDNNTYNTIVDNTGYKSDWRNKDDHSCNGNYGYQGAN